MTKVITWNIGSFSPLKFARVFKLKYNGQKILNKYFQPKINGIFISTSLEQIKPDIIFLQEIYNPGDIESIPILSQYAYKKLINTWYHKHSIIVASKKEFEAIEKNNFTIIKCNNINYIPIHLNSFYALKRYEDSIILNKIIEGLENVIILGDTNIWIRKNIFFFNNDKNTYLEFTKNLIDFSKNIISTTYVGLGFDKVFGSKNMKITNIQSIKIRGPFMDHYPVIFNMNTKSE